MRKVTAMILIVAITIITCGWSCPEKQSKGTRSLIGYLQTHEIDSYHDFLDVIQTISSRSEENELSSENISSFNIEVDYDNMIVSVTVVEVMSSEEPNAAIASVSKSYYSDIGFKLFTISLEGVFVYSTGNCSAMSATGSYTRTSLSTWTSSPVITSGNMTSRTAYAMITGTAESESCIIPYSLMLICDDEGNFSSTSEQRTSEGLAFELNEDGTASVAGIGECMDEDLVIPTETPDGIVVTSISANAFMNNKTVVSVTIPEGVTMIGADAFRDSRIQNISFPDTLTDIGESAFQHCNSLTEIVLPPHLEVIRARTFSDCLFITSIKLPEDVKVIETLAFMGCKADEIEIPESVESIARDAFRSNFLNTINGMDSLKWCEQNGIVLDQIHLYEA